MKLSIQSGATVGIYPTYKEAYQRIKDAGFDAIDWNIDTHWNYKKICAAPVLKDLCIFEKSVPEILDYFKEELDAIRAAGLEIAQAHAPFRPNDPERPEFLDLPTSNFSQIFENFTKTVDADIYVYAHATAPFITVETMKECISAVSSGKYDSAF